MFKSYFISAIRSLKKSKTYTVINVSGLALGLGLCATTIAYVAYEFSWEDCHHNHDRIYRVETTYTHNDTVQGYARVMAPLGDAIVQEVPGVLQAAVFRHFGEVKAIVNREEFSVGNVIFARPEFFEVFDVTVRSGDPHSVLSQPGGVLISDSVARMLFPDQSPVGQLVTLKEPYSGGRFELSVAGVFETMPRNTQLYCDFIAPYAASAGVADFPIDRWDLPGTDLTYLLLDKGADPAAVLGAIENVARRRLGSELANMYSFRLRPLKDIYFATYFTENRGELYPGGEYEIIFMLTAFALFILFQAIANFINLATARSADRAREVGVRKTFGAQRSQLIGQFLSESMVVTFVALVLSLPIYEFCRTGLATFVPGKEINGIFGSPVALAATLGLALLTGLAAGLYPALYLSRPQPVTVLRGRGAMQASRPWLRRSLVVFQFALAIVFIVSTIIIYRQAKFVSQFEVGFDRDNVLVLKFKGDEAGSNCALMKEQVMTLPGVIDAARTGSVMGTRQIETQLIFSTPECRDEDRIVVKRYSGDVNFTRIFGLQVTRGRDLSVAGIEDQKDAVLINESMVKELKLADPLGHMFYSTEGRTYEVVGVVKDFYGATIGWSYGSRSIITHNPDEGTILNVKMAGNDNATMLAAVQQLWSRTVPTQDFTYSFLDDDIRASYKDVTEIMKMFGVLSIVSVGIACLGILGLVSYTAEQKTKEIGIRKVLGATVPSILVMLSRELLILIGIANLIAWPVAYFLTSDFLSEFAFRINPGIGTYCIGGVLAVIIALTTAGYQSLRAARVNPVESLRNE
jgi:putative ABC transport system permease protein